jgi:two-component system chemotaxis response regulator CheY
MKILAVDDSQTIRKLIKFILRMKHHEVILAKDGLEAYSYFQEQNFNLLITDLNMPKMNGVELIKKVRMSDENNKIPIILISTESDEKDFKMCYDAGANSYIEKPFKPGKLLDEVEKYI